jgi:hypothetical protein
MGLNSFDILNPSVALSSFLHSVLVNSFWRFP